MDGVAARSDAKLAPWRIRVALSGVTALVVLVVGLSHALGAAGSRAEQHRAASDASRVAICSAFTGKSLDSKGHLRATSYVVVTAKGASCAFARTLLHSVGLRKVAGTKLITVSTLQCRLTVTASASSGTCFNSGSQPGLSPRQVTWVAAFH